MSNIVKYRGELDLAGMKIPCYVLEDGTRVISGRGMQESLKMVDVEDGKQTAGTRLTRYFNQKSLNPFFSKYLSSDHFEPLICSDGGKKLTDIRRIFWQIFATYFCKREKKSNCP